MTISPSDVLSALARLGDKNGQAGDTKLVLDYIEQVEAERDRALKIDRSKVQEIITEACDAAKADIIEHQTVIDMATDRLARFIMGVD